MRKHGICYQNSTNFEPCSKNRIHMYSGTSDYDHLTSTVKYCNVTVTLAQSQIMYPIDHCQIVNDRNCAKVHKSRQSPKKSQTNWNGQRHRRGRGAEMPLVVSSSDKFVSESDSLLALQWCQVGDRDYNVSQQNAVHIHLSGRYVLIP